MRDGVAAHKVVLSQGWLSHTPAAFQHDVLDRCVMQDVKPAPECSPKASRSAATCSP